MVIDSINQDGFTELIKKDSEYLKILYKEHLAEEIDALCSKFSEIGNNEKKTKCFTNEKGEIKKALNATIIINRCFIVLSSRQNDRSLSDFAQITNSHINQLQNYLFEIAYLESSKKAWEYFNSGVLLAIFIGTISVILSICSIYKGCETDKTLSEIQTTIDSINNKLDSIKTYKIPAEKLKIKVDK